MTLESNYNQANTSDVAQKELLKNEVAKIEVANQIIQTHFPRLTAPKLIRNSIFYFWGMALMLTFVSVHLANLFFTFYYAVPETPKYVKVSATKIALQVNSQINQQIATEEKERLALIEPQGSRKGVLTNSVEGLKNTFETQASLLAVQTGSKVGKINALPIQLTTAYQKGMQSAYQTGKKYYDVNFEVAGSQNALLVAKSGDAQDYEINLFNASLGSIKQADQALRINLNNFLNQSGNREYSLRSYLTYLKNIETGMKTNRSKITQKIQEYEFRESRAFRKMEESETNFFSALNKFVQGQTYDHLEEFVEDYQDQVDQKAHLQAMDQIDQYLSAYLPVLTAQIEAVEANRDALVHGITVVAFEDVDLGLIEIR